MFYNTLRYAFLLCLLWLLFSPDKANSEVYGELTYNIGLHDIESLEVSISESQKGSSFNLVTFVLPINISNIVEGSKDVLGYKNRDGFSIVTARYPASGEIIRIKFIMDDNVAKNAATVAKFAFGSVLISPSSDLSIFPGIKEFSNINNIFILKKFKKVKCFFPKNYTILEGNREITLKKASIFPLTFISQRNAFEIMYVAPKSIETQMVEVVFSRIVVVVLALLLSIMAPGFIPEQYYMKIVISLIALLVFFLAIKWFFALKSRDSLMSVISDTVASVVYVFAIIGLTILRKK